MNGSVTVEKFLLIIAIEVIFAVAVHVAVDRLWDVAELKLTLLDGVVQTVEKLNKAVEFGAEDVVLSFVFSNIGNNSYIVLPITIK